VLFTLGACGVASLTDATRCTPTVTTVLFSDEVIKLEAGPDTNEVLGDALCTMWKVISLCPSAW
jgi:hypothetical protein